jgi:hypothetical protein
MGNRLQPLALALTAAKAGMYDGFHGTPERRALIRVALSKVHHYPHRNKVHVGKAAPGCRSCTSICSLQSPTLLNQFRSTQKIIVPSRIQFQIPHSPGMNYDIVEVPQIDVGHIIRQNVLHLGI